MYQEKLIRDNVVALSLRTSGCNCHTACPDRLGKIGAYKASQITERGQRQRRDRDTGTGKKGKVFSKPPGTDL